MKKHEANKAAYLNRKDQRRELARTLDPTPFLAANGFVPKKDGSGGRRHYMIFDPSDLRREIVRLSFTDKAGCWQACGLHREQIGDNLRLLNHLYGNSYLDAVDALLNYAGISDSHSIAQPVPKALRTAAAVDPVKPLLYPALPEQTDADIEAGRGYLVSREIDLATITKAE